MFVSKFMPGHNGLDVDSMFEVFHGSYFSLFRDSNSLFWVFSNKFSDSVRYGPFSSLSHSFNIMKDANQFMKFIITKGVVFYD